MAKGRRHVKSCEYTIHRTAVLYMCIQLIITPVCWMQLYLHAHIYIVMRSILQILTPDVA